MWTAAAGAVAQAQNLDVIANNLANADTAGFKKDLPTFKEYLATVERAEAPKDISPAPIKDKDFYPLDGRDQAFVVMDGTHTSFKQGGLRVTQAQLDIAMDGPGFLEVNTPVGIRFTRHGSLKIAPDGKLVTSEGYSVLASKPGGISTNTSDPASRFINVKDKGPQFSISPKGELFSGGDLIAQLSVAEFQDTRKLTKTGGQLFENRDPANQTEPNQTWVRQGVIETSNVNPIEEMTNMIKANRLFEADLKALKTYGELMGREANDVGKL